MAISMCECKVNIDCTRARTEIRAINEPINCCAFSGVSRPALVLPGHTTGRHGYLLAQISVRGRMTSRAHTRAVYRIPLLLHPL
jgi:hypothetical protein